MEIGTNVTGKMVTALRNLGFDYVFDTNSAADVTIMEEATELLNRIKNNGVLPMITSCSPGWINYCEYFYGDQVDHLSTCKSPHEMMGAILKTYYAEKMGWDPKDIFMVSANHNAVTDSFKKLHNLHILIATIKQVAAKDQQVFGISVFKSGSIQCFLELCKMSVYIGHYE